MPNPLFFQGCVQPVFFFFAPYQIHVDEHLKKFVRIP
jgi:hypothetical protein